MKLRFARSFFMGVAACLIATLAWAQNTLDNPDWAELPMPPIPAFSKEQLIEISMPSYVSLKVGVDPSTVQVGSDGIVRYVVVMQNATGALSGAYEGLRCVNGEVKTYARFTASGQWTLLDSPQWRSVNDNMPSRHAQAISRQGACTNRITSSQQDTIRALKLGSRPTPR
ncbi:CNP1-like family protein [Rhodoferax aquaticus]|uniref:CNP1-like uncharacterized domain-containing protein n=1 Tax=Rhodoferax aquaticus TaxID=2527691 RepID=A0A515ESG3_9BURK|nr:CNP1-like family protein [Rhodoferax aquaticus]QDL55605.1 hypothetical protein EXZ61_16280 [Rhodoferax aquaticus]